MNTPAANSQHFATAFTPGPWRVCYDGTISANDETICHFHWQIFKEFNEDSNAANARLIAAAPELFQQLREARSILNSCGFEEPPDVAYKKSWDDALARIDAAIAAVQS